MYAEIRTTPRELTDANKVEYVHLVAGIIQEHNKSELGQEEFMALMTAQLKNQDPLKPSSDTDFIAQMAQFSSVDSLEKLNKNFESNWKNFLIKNIFSIL